MTPDCIIRKESGHITNRVQVDRWLDSLPDGVWYAKPERKNKRSNQQNRYLHGCMLPIVRDALRSAGWNHVRTLEDAKDFIKVKFLVRESVNEQTGEIMTSFGRTSELSKEQFSILVEDVAVWLWDFFQITLPPPGQQSDMFNLNAA